MNVFDKISDIRNLPGYESAREYFNKMTMGTAGLAFNQLWNKLSAEGHWLTDRYQETGPFGIFYHMANRAQFNYRKLEDDMIYHYKRGTLLPKNPVGALANQIFGLPDHMKAFVMEPYPELDHETLMHKPITDLNSNPQFLGIIAAHLFGGMM